LSFSVDTQRRILGCLDNEPSSQKNEDQASPMSSAVRQHAHPHHQSRLRSYNWRPINGQSHRTNQQRRVRLTDRYDLVGEPGNGGGDNNQYINVQLVDQYNTVGESNAVTTDEVATDEIVPRPNTELDVGTAMFTSNATSSSAETANNTLFINNIKSSCCDSTVTHNPFDVRRLLEDRPPSNEIASEDGELATYCPVPISQPPSDGDSVPSTPKLKSTRSILRKPSFKKNKKKGIPSVMNAFVTILSCVCLLGCLLHSSASPFNEIPPSDLECNTVEFVHVDDTASRCSSSNVEIKVSRSIQEASARGNTTVDGGANGCVAGRELKPISYTGEDAKHQLNNLPICTCAGVHDLSDGTSILCIFNRYAYHADGNTIHSKIQLQDNGNFVDDCLPNLVELRRLLPQEDSRWH